MHYCGASILNNRFLLTAAHCTLGTEKSDPAYVYAVVGAYRLSEGGVEVELDKITPHSGFSIKKLANDIALVRTAKEITFTDMVKPIALPKSALEAGERVMLTGWGKNTVGYTMHNDLNVKNDFKILSKTLEFIVKILCSLYFSILPILYQMFYSSQNFQPSAMMIVWNIMTIFQCFKTSFVITHEACVRLTRKRVAPVTVNNRLNFTNNFDFFFI